jgi:hypothetical protein
MRNIEWLHLITLFSLIHVQIMYDFLFALAQKCNDKHGNLMEYSNMIVWCFVIH